VLVLSRKRSEQVVIGVGVNQVVLTLVDIRGDKCRIGFEAPKELPVHRREVYDAIERENAKQMAREAQEGST
jgi:carbon storage regulator